jgi:hypothetical protein
VKEIAGRLPAKGYRFSALVLEIVNSLPFQARTLAGDVPQRAAAPAAAPAPAAGAGQGPGTR